MLTTSKLNKLVLPKAVQRASFADEDGAGVWRSCRWRVGELASLPSSPSGARVVPWHCALTGVLTSQIRLKISCNSHLQGSSPHKYQHFRWKISCKSCIFFSKSEKAGCSEKYGGSTEVDHQLCRLAIVTLLLHTLKMFQPPNSTFSLSGFSYYTTTTHVQKKVRKTI